MFNLLEVKPHIPTPQIDIDFHIESMRQKLFNSLDWLDEADAYGLALRQMDNTEQGQRFAPVIYSGNGEHYDLSTNSNKQAETYFYIRSFYDAVYSTNLAGRTKTYVTEFSIIFNINVDLIRQNLKSEYSVHQFIEQVRDIEFSQIKEAREVKIQRVFFNRFEDIYQDFNFWLFDPNFTFHPQNAFRISYSMTFGMGCNLNTPSKSNHSNHVHN